MAKDQRGSVVIHLAGVKSGLDGEKNVVNDKRIVSLDNIDVADGKTGRIQGIACSRNVCLPHVSSCGPTFAVTKNLDRRTCLSHFTRARFAGNKNTRVAIGRMRLGTESHCPAWDHGFQIRESLLSRLSNTLITINCDRRAVFPVAWNLKWRQHVASLKLPVIRNRIQVLFVARQRKSILLTTRDAARPGDIFRRFDHRDLGVGIIPKVVPHPIFTPPPAPGPERVRVVDVRSIARAITRARQYDTFIPNFDFRGRGCDQTRRRGARLRDGRTRDPAQTNHCRNPRRPPKTRVLRHRNPEVNAVDLVRRASSAPKGLPSRYRQHFH